MRKFTAGILLLLACALAPAAPKKAADIPLGSLPKTATPLHYTLSLKLDPAQAAYEGDVQIRVRLEKPAASLWMHGRDLRVASVSVLDAAGAEHTARYEQVHEDGVARLHFPRELTAQELTLRFRFAADYNLQLAGLYKVEHDGTPYLMTQMEAVEARRAFPSFDEPAFKTPIELNLTVPADLVAVANERVVDESRSEGWKTLRFAPTPPLPTYLVAFAVGSWDVVEAPPIPASEVRPEPVPLRALAPRGEGPRLKFALDETPALFLALERYFGLPYPYGKLDVLAVPEMSFGAMENAGLITFRARNILVDAGSPLQVRSAFILTQSHEIAHQWFGNLVTMPWWDDIWLNEAFATWVSTKLVHEQRPELHVDLTQLASTLDAMALDSLVSARRVREPVLNSEDLEHAFDSITYDKGGAVLGMLEGWVGAEGFREGIRSYLRQHLHGNATSDDLIAALAAASEEPKRLEQAARSLLDQAGLPLVAARMNCSAQGSRLHLRQERYLPAGSRGAGTPRWQLPICFRHGQADVSASGCTYLEQREQGTDLGPGCPAWLMPNAGARGYYRFSLPPLQLAALSARAAKLEPAEQMMFADAIDGGFRRGDLDAAQVLDAMTPLATSRQWQVATALQPSFRWVYLHLASDAERAVMRDYLRELYFPTLQELGLTARDGEPRDDALLREHLAQFLAIDAELPELRKQLLAIVESALGGESSGQLQLGRLDPNLVPTLLTVWVQERGAAATERIREELESNDDGMQRRTMQLALGSSTDPALAPALLDYGLGDEVKPGEILRIYSAHGLHPRNHARYWTWFQRNFDKLLARAPQFVHGVLPQRASEGWCSAKEAASLERFFKPRLARVQGGVRGLAEAAETVRLCSALKQRQGNAALRRWARQRAASKIEAAAR